MYKTKRIKCWPRNRGRESRDAYLLLLTELKEAPAYTEALKSKSADVKVYLSVLISVLRMADVRVRRKHVMEMLDSKKGLAWYQKVFLSQG